MNSLSIIPDSGETVHEYVNLYHIFHKRNVGGRSANIEQWHFLFHKQSTIYQKTGMTPQS